ncbi:AAA family ATPase [Bradyrhizobium manausense]|uniref:AAA family ATPase n=1 Tax=Bradyrhizobium manausense TaxID=989370 RepID=UPI001BA7CF8C|nr:AAA family ATPase [Bradyrhizobium manausense]MBR0684406.1 AAA family ATPase [Bradyrhizobium manausense]
MRSPVMGALETSTYRRLWRSSMRFRSRLAKSANVSGETDDLPPVADSNDGSCQEGGRVTLRQATTRMASTSQEVRAISRKGAFASAMKPVPPHRVVASLLFARVFDERPELLRSIQEAAPTIIIDISDRQMLDQLESTWQDILVSGRVRLLDASQAERSEAKPDLAIMIVKEPPKTQILEKHEQIALNALCLARPLIAMSPMAQGHLPDILIRAATTRIDFPKLDTATIVKVIRIVTGKVCREPIDAKIVERTTLADLVIAVRFDRTPAQCVAELRRLNAAKESMRAARDLTLADLHGLGEAHAWAEAAISDIKAWKDGRIPWSQVPSGIALSGPPGCGKTTFAAVFCREAGLHMVGATLAKWQSSGEAHLGHLLRAMRQDFEEARANTPSCVFIDEIDSFPARAGITHDWRDYVVEVVNALLAEIDGIKGRDGVIVIGASNEISRCEPALLRAGRLEKIVAIGLPSSAELELMFRVRLQADLVQEDLTAIVELTAGMVGADVERVVKDARRFARQAGERAMTLNDLRNAIVRPEDRPIEQRWRHCIHEAAHLLVDVILFGPYGVLATMSRIGQSGGRSVRTIDAARFFGTPDDYRRRLQVILAGRAGEELLLGSVSHGAGGEPGLGSDLEEATKLASAMVTRLGLAGAGYLTYFGRSQNARDDLAFSEIREAVGRELTDAAMAASVLVRAHRSALEAVAHLLLSRGRASGTDVTEVLRGRGSDRKAWRVDPLKAHGSADSEQSWSAKDLPAAPTMERSDG